MFVLWKGGGGGVSIATGGGVPWRRAELSTLELIAVTRAGTLGLARWANAPWSTSNGCSSVLGRVRLSAGGGVPWTRGVVHWCMGTAGR